MQDRTDGSDRLARDPRPAIETGRAIPAVQRTVRPSLALDRRDGNVVETRRLLGAQHVSRVPVAVLERDDRTLPPRIEPARTREPLHRDGPLVLVLERDHVLDRWI